MLLGECEDGRARSHAGLGVDGWGGERDGEGEFVVRDWDSAQSARVGHGTRQQRYREVLGDERAERGYVVYLVKDSSFKTLSGECAIGEGP